MSSIKNLTQFMEWHKKIQNVHPITNSTWEVLLQKFNEPTAKKHEEALCDTK